MKSGFWQKRRHIKPCWKLARAKASTKSFFAMMRDAQTHLTFSTIQPLPIALLSNALFLSTRLVRLKSRGRKRDGGLIVCNIFRDSRSLFHLCTLMLRINNESL